MGTTVGKSLSCLIGKYAVGQDPWWTKLAVAPVSGLLVPWLIRTVTSE
jgi:hypothetical protein